VSEIIGVLPAHVPQIYISKTPCTHIQFDTTLLGNCDDVIRDLVRRGGFTLVHEMLVGGRGEVGEGWKWREVGRGVWEVVSEEEGDGMGETINGGEAR
jgi:NAD-dependent histone deacetylase SIR2